MFGYVRASNGRTPPDPSVWHLWRLFLPARDPEGYLVIGSVWRRRAGATWQYKSRTTSILAKIYERERPDSYDQWHKWNLLGWPTRSLEGQILIGRVWRRRRDSKWEYRNRSDETDRIPGDW